jgi:sugar (pentulose or hexulose) kinase
MSCLLGIDLGTSSVKVVTFGVRGALKGVGLAEYPILTPRLGYAEQDPEQWWRATVTAVREALDKAGHPEILGIGFSGQMHGLVLLDRGKRLLRPAIIWADQRSAELLPEIEDRVGRSLLAQRCGTAPTAGFAIASLYWLQKFEPQTLERAATWMLPKDFLRFKLTGELGTDESDAASSGLFDVGQRVWADEVIGRLALPRSLFPKVHASADVVGPLSEAAAAELGLRHSIPVSAGCADQPAQAVGNGLLDPPLGSVTIGHRRPSVRSVNPAAHRFGITAPHVLSRASRQVVPPGSDVVCRHGAEMAPVGAGKGRGLLRGTRSTGCGSSTGFRRIIFYPLPCWGAFSAHGSRSQSRIYWISSASRSWALRTGAVGGSCFRPSSNRGYHG